MKISLYLFSLFEKNKMVFYQPTVDNNIDIRKKWMASDDILDYLDILSCKYNQDKILISNGYFLVTSKYSFENETEDNILKRFKTFSIKHHQTSDDRRKIKKVTFNDIKKWIIIVNESNVHWWCIVVFIQEKKIYVYDSLYDINSCDLRFSEEHKQKTELLMQCMYQHILSSNIVSLIDCKWSLSICPMLQRQIDNYNCGVFVLNVVELNLKYYDHFIYDIYIDTLYERDYINNIIFTKNIEDYIDIDDRQNIYYKKLDQDLLILFDKINFISIDK